MPLPSPAFLAFPLSGSPFTYHSNELENSVVAIHFPPRKCNSNEVEDKNYQSSITEQIMILIFSVVLFSKMPRKYG